MQLTLAAPRGSGVGGREHLGSVAWTDGLRQELRKPVLARVCSAQPKHALAAVVGWHGGMGWDGTGQDGMGLTSLQRRARQNEPQQKDRKSLPEGGKKSVGLPQMLPDAGRLLGQREGLASAVLMGFAAQLMVGDTGLELILRNKWQKTERVY